MSLNYGRKHNRSATILIETRQITSNLEKANGIPGLRCFISTAWDLQHDHPIDQCLSCGGTLAEATIRSPEILAKPLSGFNSNSSRCHLRHWYQYHGVRHEVSAIHNGCVWLRPVAAKAKVREEPVQTHVLHKSNASLTQQPSAIQRLVGFYAESMYFGAGMKKVEASRQMQSEIQIMNLSRRSDDHLKIPSQKTMSLFIDEYLTRALSDGLASRRSIVKEFAGVSRKPLDQQTLHPAEQLSPELEQ
ncbi:hypothetical protein [Pseudomonas sp. PSB11]|uniref:hypothetical protein n=1 Tax=Pseudomonas sp. PSB11 TaxID=2021969 RepID=UPI00166075BA|nr:hypothetical protein [Pseudomonas sp. PSB11]